MNHAEELNRLINSANVSLGRQELAIDAVPIPNLFFTTSVIGMKAVSHVIEDQALNSPNALHFYSAFQKLSRAKQQRNRYDKLATLGSPIYVFGVPDEPLWQSSGLLSIPIKEDVNPNLAQNWFVVLHDPKLVSIALISRELPPSNRPSGAVARLLYRNFEGFWTYDTAIITQIVDVLDDYIKAKKG
jgi:DICT domain-containing protein